MEIPGNTVDLEINRGTTPPELEVSIYGSMVTMEQEEQWNQKLAAAHPEFKLNLINNGINEADIEEMREQLAFMMNSFSDLTAKDRQIQQLNAELTLTSGRLRQLESKLLPVGIGNELYTICPSATRVRWGRINEQGPNAQVPETFMAQLEVTLNAPFPRPEMEDSLQNLLSQWLQARLATNHRMEVSIQYETPLP